MRINPALAGLGAHPIAAIQDRVREMRSRGEELVDFSIGDPREATPSFIREAMIRAIPEVSQYPTTKGLPELRRAIAGYVKRRFAVDVDPETQVLPTTGSKEAIFSTPLAFVDREGGDAVVWASPGYPIYERGAVMAGAVAHAVRLGPDFVFRADMVPAEVWPRTAIVWTCSPHNPTGSVMADADIDAMLARTREHGALLCADECYMDLYEDDPPRSVLEFAGPDLSGALSYLSLSKRSGMTGYRSAAVVGDAAAIAALVSLRTSTGTAPPEFTQTAAAAAWSDDAHASERRSIFSEKRRVLRRAFDAAGLETVASKAGLYMWVAVDDDLEATARLLDSGVVVSPGRAFGTGGEGFLRLALVPTVGECGRAVEAVIKCLKPS